MAHRIKICDNCCNGDCHQTRKELLACKREIKKRAKLLKDTSTMVVVSSRVKINDDKEIVDFEPTSMEVFKRW